ncbi:ATP-binding protein [Streptomyces sp. NPDC086023]|uniref:ATP-binding protein n=1 Tax=Streptomyces sp. NPDC086023 TaxID=3365746 RepID=UPI0037D29B6A
MSGLRDSAARPDRAARPDHAARPDRGPGRADRRDGGRRARTPARHTTSPRTASPGAPRRITPLLVRAAVLPTLAAGSSGAAAVLSTLRLGARPDGRLWLVLSGCGLLFAAALTAALLGAHRAARAVRDRCEALRRSSARGQQELRTVLDRLERGETVPERRAGGALTGGPGRTREPGRAAEPAGPDEFAALSGELREAREQAHAALVRAADLAGRSDSDQKVEVFVNLARRLQSLVHREIQLLDGLEDTVEDPDLLKELFHVDHLATRIRRHAENLAVLGGAASRRQWTRPIDVSEVLRSSVAEVEQYTRVKVVPPAAGSVRGHAVADVVHLLAELVENATVFSPPDTDVVLRAERVTAGIAIEVEDRGLGMPAEEQHRMNALLDDPDQVSVRHLLADGRIGLFVVSALARRHGIAVELKSNIYGGVLAVLVLPRDLLGADAADATRPTVTGTGTGLPVPPLEPARGPVPGPVASGVGAAVGGAEFREGRAAAVAGGGGSGVLGDAGSSRAWGARAVSGAGAGREEAGTGTAAGTRTGAGTGGHTTTATARDAAPAPVTSSADDAVRRTALPRRVRASAVEQAAIPQQARSAPRPAPGGDTTAGPRHGDRREVSASVPAPGAVAPVPGPTAPVPGPAAPGPTPGTGPEREPRRTDGPGADAAPAPGYLPQPGAGVEAAASGPSLRADAAVAPGAPWGAAPDAWPPDAWTSASGAPGESWAAASPDLVGAGPRPVAPVGPLGSTTRTPVSVQHADTDPVSPKPGGTGPASRTPAPAGAQPPVRPAGPVPPEPEPGAAQPSVRPAGPPSTEPVPDAVPRPAHEPAGAAARPALPRRRAQEHLAPQLRDAPGPVVRAGGGGEQPVHDPQLMAAFRRGFGLAQAAAEEDRDPDPDPDS